MADLIALYDACVLYPAPLRDLLMHLAGTGLFRARWTNEIHEEWIRSVLENRPDLSRAQLERTRDLMNEHFLDSLVTGYEYLIPEINLPDEEDRHVVAAAIQGSADVIVTFNRKDFPEAILSQYKMETQHPDIFIGQLMDLNEANVITAVRKQRLNLKRPTKTAEELLQTLNQQGLNKTVERLLPAIDLL